MMCTLSFIKNYITNNLLWVEGKSLLVIIVGLGLLGYFIVSLFLYAALFLFLFCFYFFRNPKRTCKELLTDSSLLVCPADGRVVAIEQIDDSVYSQKIALFLSPLDVHVTRAPVTGKIIDVVYHEGEFAMAFLPKSSDLNERNDIVIQMHNGTLFKVRQIAGTIARVIVCWVKKDDQVIAGSCYGMIKFGSRVELFVPRSVTITIKVGQKVYGGQTVLGKVQS
ncbi:phosphatidylserine decarboxylase [bacterium]|nr:phosphatidylserine decarboxylase [bacterium]